MTMYKSVLLLLALTVSALSSADELLMNNGSRLVGTILSAGPDGLVFDTPFAGQIKIAQGNIERIISDQKVNVMMQDGTIYRDQQIAADGEALVMIGSDQAAVRFDITEIKLLNPEPWKMGDGYLWSGQINTAMKAERGNTDTDEFDVDFESKWRSLEDRFTTTGNREIDEADGVKNKDVWNLRGKYDRFREYEVDDYYGAQLAFKKDELADLDLRTTMGPYVGRQFYESGLLTLAGEVGVVYVQEEFTVAEDDDFWGGSWEMRATSYIIPKIELYINQTGVLNFNDMSGMLVDTTIGFGFPLVMGIQAGAEMKFEYDGGAAQGVDDLDQTYTFKLGYQW